MHNLTDDWKRFKPLIWYIGTAFSLIQFFLQLSSGVVIAFISRELSLNALSAGLLSGMFYLIYTSLQIPVGMLCDKYNPKPLMTSCALLCSIGCLIFGASHSLVGLYFGRGLLAVGSAFAFVCLTHLIRQNYPKRLFGILIGASEMFCFFITVLGIVGQGAAIHYWGWRAFMNVTAVVCCIVAFLCWHYLPKPSNKPKKSRLSTLHVTSVFTSIPIWINGLFIGLTFCLVMVFGALWAPLFMKIKLQCTIRQASIMDAMFILGVGISCPIFGYLANIVKSRKQLIIRACIATVLMLLMVIYLPVHNLYLMGGMMLVLGLVSGSYILGYTFANELSPPNALSTTTGLTNTLGLITAPILQPLIGYIIDKIHAGRPVMLHDYQQALLILPVGVLIAIVLISFLNLRPPPSGADRYTP